MRSERSLIQTFGRASRNVRGKVVLYADKVTDSMRKAIEETDRRRNKQAGFNEKHGITPETVVKDIQTIRDSVYEQDYVTVQTDAEEEEKLLAKGDLHKLLKKLRAQMEEASSNLEFELAAQIRDRIRELEQLELVMG